MRRSARLRPSQGSWRVPLTVATIYGLFGVAWIVLTDRLLSVIVDDPGLLSRLQTVKGWLFVTLTAALLLWLVRRSFLALQRVDWELRRINKTLHTLRACNQRLIRWPDAAMPLEEVCQTIVEVGGYCRAWISFVDEQRPNVVNRVAEAGRQPLIQDDGQDVEPCFEALARGTPTVVRELPHDVQGQLWRSATARRSDSSLVVLPLATRERVFGALTVCANDPHAFGTEETRLLEQLASDLTGALAVEHAQAGHGQTREQLRESQRVLATLMGNLPGMAYRCRNDRAWTMEFVSEGCRELTGYESSDLLNNAKLSYADLIHPEDQASIWDEVQTALVEREPFRLMYRIQSADGQWKWVWEQGRGICDDQGDVVALEGFVTDITDRKQLEEQLRQAQKMEAVGQLAGGVAHDFNNILTAILGQIDLIKGRPEQIERVREALNQIDQAAQLAATLTRHLLAFGRRRSGRAEVLDLRAILEAWLPMIERLTGEYITLELDLSSEPCLVRADAGQLEQIVTNLVLNARDAMPGGGTLEIALSRIEADQAYANNHPGLKPGAAVLLRVTDTGCGMSPEELSQIYQPFFTTKAPGKGTGLGLSTVLTIARQHGGCIQAESDPGQGTTFRLYLPRVEVAQPQPVAAAPSEPCGGHETLLLVEDEALVREAARQILLDAGYRVLDVGNGQAAVQLVQECRERIDLLICDVVLPDAAGPALVQQIKAQLPQLRVLFVSGHGDDVLAHHGVTEADAVLLQKPYGADALLRTIRSILGAEGTASASGAGSGSSDPAS